MNSSRLAVNIVKEEVECREGYPFISPVYLRLYGILRINLLSPAEKNFWFPKLEFFVLGEVTERKLMRKYCFGYLQNQERLLPEVFY